MTKSVFTDEYALMIRTLIALRKRQGMSQAKLAGRLGRTQPFISHIEHGDRRIDPIEFHAIVKALDADPVAVFAEVASKLPAKMKI